VLLCRAARSGDLRYQSPTFDRFRMVALLCRAARSGDLRYQSEERVGRARRRDTSTTSRSKARMGSMRPVLIC